MPLRWTPGPRTRRTALYGAIALIGVLGAALGLVLGGRIQTPVGPANVSLTTTLSLNGGTVVDVPPLGSLRLDSHYGPFRLNAQIVRLRPETSQNLLNDPEAVQNLTDTIGAQVRHGILWLAVRGFLAGLASAFLLALLLLRSWRRALIATAAGFTAMTTMMALAALTFRPSSVAEPRYTGLLANAPQLVGDARTVVNRFEEYRAMLAKLVGNVSQLYTATSTLPVYTPDPDTIRVLHVSDIHLSPVAWDVIRTISTQFKANLIIDSGDLTDHGSRPEDRFANEISTFSVPYVYVRGNHDSTGTQSAVSKIKNAVVLDGQTKTVDGLKIYGVGDPRFTPDKTTADDDFTDASLYNEGQAQAQPLKQTPPDLVVVHDPNQGRAFDGITPLILTGHTHDRKTTLLPSGSRLFTQGSTGGAGLRGLEHDTPTPIQLSLLYFTRATHTLKAWDDFTVGGLGLSSVQVERHLSPPVTLTQPPTLPSPSLP
ncbi:metallophosphoesterase, partial [Actinocorallia longicatena]|uniref:metallophosphoesterase family protein n=1 Tax=Actinocorallia longicatena TaxID=111803 RepID=UPI0031D5A381